MFNVTWIKRSVTLRRGLGARAVTLRLCRLLEVTPRTRPTHGECARHCFGETLDATNGREPDAINGGEPGW